jgi:endonuclease/exonuclease/phosphatase family metal-dependent hydrolase
MRRHAVFVLVCLAACANRADPTDKSLEETFPKAPLAEPSGDLRVVTFNVHRETTEKVLKGILTDRGINHADVFVLQEVHRVEPGPKCSPACSLGQQLGYYSLYAPGHMQGNGSDGIAIVSRLPFTSAQVLELPYFNVHTNSGRRIALIATVELRGKPITIYAVHLDNRLNPGDRKTQMLPVLRHAQQQKTPVIIAGDFNTGPATWIAHLIPILTTTQDNHFERLVRKHGFETPVRESGPTHRYIGMRLDGIYTRGFDTLKFATADARNVSDHLALWATLRPRPSLQVVPSAVRSAP